MWPHFERPELEVTPISTSSEDDVRFLAFSHGEADLSFRSGFRTLGAAGVSYKCLNASTEVSNFQILNSFGQ